MHQIHEGLQVGGRPPFVKVCVTKAQIALADQAGKEVIVVDVHLGHRAGFGPFGPERAAIGQDEIHPPMLHRLRHGKDLREIARQTLLPLCCRQLHTSVPFLFLAPTVTAGCCFAKI